MAKILSKFGEQQLVMVNYACGFNQSEIISRRDSVIEKIGSQCVHADLRAFIILFMLFVHTT